MTISGIGGNLSPLSPRGAVDFRITSLKSGGRRFPVQAIVLRKVTSDLPSSPTPLNDKWKHLSGLELADPDFGTPGTIDLLLGTEVFGQVVLNGRRFGPRGSPTALKTHFGWVLGGAVNSEGQRDSETCCLTTTADPLGKTRTLAVKRFRSLERSNGKFDAFAEDMNEYFEQTRTERAPP